jgi:hypothetical protein
VEFTLEGRTAAHSFIEVVRRAQRYRSLSKGQHQTLFPGQGDRAQPGATHAPGEPGFPAPLSWLNSTSKKGALRTATSHQSLSGSSCIGIKLQLQAHFSIGKCCGVSGNSWNGRQEGKGAGLVYPPLARSYPVRQWQIPVKNHMLGGTRNQSPETGFIPCYCRGCLPDATIN